MLYAGEKRFDEALETFKSMMQMDPRSINALTAQFQIGRVYAAQKRFDDAIACYTQVLVAIGNDPQVLFDRGEAFEQKGELGHAREDFEQVARINPQFPHVQDKISAIRARQSFPLKY